MICAIITAMTIMELKEYANKKGIKIIGDIPIYVAEDSVDLWANRENFQFFENGRLRRVAATPSEDF